MQTPRILILLLPSVLAACQTETGIDRTFIVGQIALTPSLLEEGVDGVANPNDEGFVGLPALTYRYTSVAGTARGYESEDKVDVDLYFTSTTASSPLTMRFEYSTDSVLTWPDREELVEGVMPRMVDTVIYKVEVVDPTWIDAETGEYVVLASFDDPDGHGGLIEFDWASVTVPTVGGGTDSPYADGVPAGTQIGVRVTAVKGDSTGDISYTLAFSGHDPNTGRILVGAYESSDPSARGNPVMGGTAYGFWWDEANKTWNGWYEMEGGARRVVECEKGDQECLDSLGAGTAARSAGSASIGDTGDTGGDGGTTDGGTADGGTADGGTADGGTADGGTADGGTADGGTADGGTADGGTADGGTADGGTADGGTADGGTADGGTADGGTADGGTADGGTADGGTADGGTADGGTADGGTADGGTAGDGGEEEEDPGKTGAVAEGASEVWIMAGTFKSLAGSIPGGTYYSSQMVPVSLDAQHVVVNDLVVMDDLSPKVYGWTANEDTDGSYEVPTLLPTPTGSGFVDVITGSLLYETDDPQGANEVDAFAFVPEVELNGLFTASWPDAGTNMDLYLIDGEGAYIAAAYLLGDTNPEGFNASDDFGILFQPGESYILEMQSWTGLAGEKPYTIEIEWYAP